MALGYDARCIKAMVDRKEITKKHAQQIFAQFFGLSNEVNDESEQKDVNALHQRAWTKATFLISQGKAFQQTPLVGLIPVANFSAKKHKPGPRQRSMVMLYGLLVDALSAAADAQPPQPGAEPLQPCTALKVLFETTSGHDSLRAVTSVMITAAQTDLAAALLGSEIAGGLCHRFGQSIKDHAEWSSLRDVMPDYRLPSEKTAETERLEETHKVGDIVTFIPLIGGKSTKSRVCVVLPGNRYRLCAKGQQWEDSGARLEKYKKKPTSPKPPLRPPSHTSGKTNRGGGGGPSAKTNRLCAASGQSSKKRLKPSGHACVKTNDRPAAKQKRKGGDVAIVDTKGQKKRRFEVAFSEVEGDGDPVVVAEVFPVDTDDSDVEYLPDGALEDKLHRTALLKEQEKESKNRLMLQRKEKVLKDRMANQKFEFKRLVEVETKNFTVQKVRQ